MRESRSSGSVEGVMSNRDPYSDSPEPGWSAFAPPTLLGRRSRHCHGINSTNYGFWVKWPRG